MSYEEKILTIVDDPAKCRLPPMAPVLAMFLMNFRPLIPTANSAQNRNSKEIAVALENLCDIPINDVAAVMLYLGYTMTPNDYGELMWAMEYTGN